MGFYALCVTNAPHIAPIAGGGIAQNLTWRWCFYVPAILQGGLLVILLLTLPETLYSRSAAANLPKRAGYFPSMFHFGRIIDRRIKPRDYLNSFRMIRYAAVILPCIFYSTANTYASLLFAVTGAQIAATLYQFDPLQTGLVQLFEFCHVVNILAC
jgi:MFS family permease